MHGNYYDLTVLFEDCRTTAS